LEGSLVSIDFSDHSGENGHWRKLARSREPEHKQLQSGRVGPTGVVMRPPVVMQKAPQEPNSTENPDDADDLEKWKLATGTALCTEISALYTKSREGGVQRGKSWKIGENAESARIA